MKNSVKVISLISSFIISLILTVIFSISAGAAEITAEPTRITGDNGDIYTICRGEQDDDLSAFMSSTAESVNGTDVLFMGTCDGYYYAAWTSGTERISVRVNRSMTLDEFKELITSYM